MVGAGIEDGEYRRKQSLALLSSSFQSAITYILSMVIRGKKRKATPFTNAEISRHFPHSFPTTIKSNRVGIEDFPSLSTLPISFPQSTINTIHCDTAIWTILCYPKKKIRHRWFLFLVPYACRIGDLQELQELGLFLTDLSMHDLSREMVLAGWQHNSRWVSGLGKERKRKVFPTTSWPRGDKDIFRKEI